MERCEICMPLTLEYEIKFLGSKNLTHLPRIIQYFEKEELLIQYTNDVITIKEEAVAGLYDYVSDNMEVEEVLFRIGKSEWHPINEAIEPLELQWIDKVIFDDLVTFHKQPIVNAKEEIYAHEMLARFHDENGNAIGPYDVFQAAKKRNRTYALDRVCRMAAVRNAVYVDSKVFINFIPTSIYSPEHCLKSTVSLATELGIEPSRFVFEVVETEKVNDITHLKNILTYYKDRGFRYALDDVGEGFSTVEVLEKLSPHYMKLDMKFVQGVSHDPIKQKAASKLLKAAVKIGAIPLAEGIEDQSDFIWLRNVGYELFQGYYFGKPAPVI